MAKVKFLLQLFVIEYCFSFQVLVRHKLTITKPCDNCVKSGIPATTTTKPQQPAPAQHRQKPTTSSTSTTFSKKPTTTSTTTITMKKPITICTSTTITKSCQLQVLKNSDYGKNKINTENRSKFVGWC